ncbi:MAG: hypothetical protein AB9836_02230 [Aminipila sp.]
MYINFGDNLFMPEGDDYSKTEFDKTAEEIALEGTAILQELRIQQVANQALRPLPVKKIQNKTVKSQGKEQKKLTYKEIFDEMAASRK